MQGEPEVNIGSWEAEPDWSEFQADKWGWDDQI